VRIHWLPGETRRVVLVSEEGIELDAIAEKAAKVGWKGQNAARRSADNWSAISQRCSTRPAPYGSLSSPPSVAVGASSSRTCSSASSFRSPFAPSVGHIPSSGTSSTAICLRNESSRPLKGASASCSSAPLLCCHSCTGASPGWISAFTGPISSRCPGSWPHRALRCRLGLLTWGDVGRSLLSLEVRIQGDWGSGRLAGGARPRPPA